jgi:hypothetical protein
MLLGFAAARRRSELVAFTMADLERSADGLVLHIRPQDRPGGARRARLRPVQAIETWLVAARHYRGPTVAAEK